MYASPTARALMPAAAFGLLLLTACTPDVDSYGETDEPQKRTVPLKLPRNRLPRKEEEKLIEVLDDLRGVDAEYLARIKAEELVTALIGKGQTGAVDYVVPLLSDPKWDVRAAALRILVKHGRTCPEAVTSLVQVVGDPAMNAAVRDDAAKALRGWTGLYFGYNAWAAPHMIKTAAAKWKVWLDESGGVIPDAE